MNVFIENQKVDTELLQVPTMNYGQMQRWQNAIKLHHAIEIEKEVFFEKIEVFFEEFRNEEIKDNDTFDFKELIAFKNNGWSNLSSLINHHPLLLKDLIIFNQYDVLHLIVENAKKIDDYFYSANTVDSILFKNKTLILEGICF